jgi:hypothetical protein
MRSQARGHGNRISEESPWLRLLAGVFCTDSYVSSRAFRTNKNRPWSAKHPNHGTNIRHQSPTTDRHTPLPPLIVQHHPRVAGRPYLRRWRLSGWCFTTVNITQHELHTSRVTSVSCACVVQRSCSWDTAQLLLVQLSVVCDGIDKNQIVNNQQRRVFEEDQTAATSTEHVLGRGWGREGGEWRWGRMMGHTRHNNHPGRYDPHLPITNALL